MARDLVKRGVTSHDRLACEGGSNGGLLVGNMLTRSPELWGGIICAVPLLDMYRFSKLLAGASWMGEYGDPDDAEQWRSLQRYSPYHQVKPETTYPPILFTTSTRDDRVHPAHARKMVHKLLEVGLSGALYYENVNSQQTQRGASRCCPPSPPSPLRSSLPFLPLACSTVLTSTPPRPSCAQIEGGHGGAADNKQRAFMKTLGYAFLQKALVDKAIPPSQSVAG